MWLGEALALKWTDLDSSGEYISVQRSVHAALRHAHPLSIRVHDLRHTFATLAFSQRVSAREVQEILGHANVQTTLNTYTHVTPQMTRQAIDRVGNLLAGDVLPEDPQNPEESEQSEELEESDEPDERVS